MSAKTYNAARLAEDKITSAHLAQLMERHPGITLESLVEQFQVSVDLKKDGYLGPKTCAALVPVRLGHPLGIWDDADSSGPRKPVITSRYWTRNPSRRGTIIKGKYRPKHYGVDLMYQYYPVMPRSVIGRYKNKYCMPALEVYAAYHGVVTLVSWLDKRGGGIEIDHGNGYKTQYIHLERSKKGDVKVGDRVITGMPIGRVLVNEKVMKPPHLHFGMKYLDNYIDPEPFIFGAAFPG